MNQILCTCDPYVEVYRQFRIIANVKYEFSFIKFFAHFISTDKSLNSVSAIINDGIIYI